MNGYYEENGDWIEIDSDGRESNLGPTAGPTPLTNENSGTQDMAGWKYDNGVWTSPTGVKTDLTYLNQGTGVLAAINKALGTNLNVSDLAKLGIGAGGLAGLLGAGTPTVKPTGYQGGIPQLTASQPMLTEPPPGRRPGSGGINYGTGVQYKDAKGNIVSDTSTPVADLYKKATQQGTYNDWGHQYGQGTTGGGLTNLPSGGNTGGTDNSALIAQLRALLAARGGSTGGPAAGSGVVNPPVNNGIATGIDPNRPWAKASSDPTIKAAQDALDQLSKTQGTPEQRQAALTNFLHTTKYTPTQLAAASNGQWGVQDLIDQMQGNTNVFNAQTPWSVYSTKADVKGVQDALQQLSQTPGTAAEKQAALTNFLKTTNYTPAQLAAASNGMWSVADLSSQMAGNPNLTAANTVDPSHPWTTASSDQTIQGAQAALAKLNATTGTPAERQAVLANFLKTTTYTPAQLAAASNGQWGVADLTAQMAGNPVLKQASNTPAGGSNTPAASTPTGGGFVTGGGGPMSQAEYDKAVAIKKAQDAADQAKLDAYHVSPDSPLYKYIQDPSLIPHQYGETDAQAVARVKSQDMERTNTAAYRSTLSNVSPGGGFVVSNGYIGRDPTANETNTVVQDANGQSRYMTKAEAAAQEKATQDYLKAHGNILDTEHPWNVASTDTGTQSAQAALAQLNATTGTPAERQAALVNFLKTTTYTPEQLSAASNGQWSIKDLTDQMVGNKNLPEQGGPPGAENVGSAGLANVAPVITPAPVVLDSIQNEPAAPLTGLAALNAAAQTTYGRALTDAEQQALSGKSLEDAQGIMTQSMADWNASHPSTPQVDTPQPTVYAGDPSNGAYTFAHGGLTNLDHGGFVIPADVVSHFGNGSSEAGLKLLQHKLGATPIRGHGDGMSDSIPAAIDGREKALVANEEAYISPQMVQRLGGGSMDKGSQKLAHMMEKIRKARTGSKEQGKQVNPNNFMPGGTVGYAQGGGIKRYAGTTDPTASLVQSGVTGTEQNLSNWSGPAVTQMLGQAQALANTPYQAYTGPLTAGASDLQNTAFNNAANLSVPSGVDQAGYNMAQIGQQAQNMSYAPTQFGNQFQAPTPYQNTNFTSGTFDSGAAQQYMNPYLQQSLNPQLDEARRQSNITAQQNNAAMTKAGAFGGGRQAILTSENQRNLGTNQANITGQGYNTAYTNAMSQFNSDQARNMQAQQAAEQSKQFGANQGMTAAQMAAQYGLAGQQAGEQSRQFGANYGIQGLNTALQSAQGMGNLGIASGGLSLQNLQQQAALGAAQRGIESEGIAADKAQFEAARQDPYTKLQFQQSMFNGLPITAQNYNMSQPSGFQAAAGGATTVADLLAKLGYKVTP